MFQKYPICLEENVASLRPFILFIGGRATAETSRLCSHKNGILFEQFVMQMTDARFHVVTNSLPICCKMFHQSGTRQGLHRL